MNLGSLAQNIGLSTGNVVAEDANLQQQYAQTANVRSETAMRQMTMMMQQKEMADSQFRAQDFAARMQTTQQGLSTTDQIASAATKTEADLAAKGDYKGAMEMAKMASGATAETKALKAEQEAEKKQGLEVAAKSALNYGDVLETNPEQRQAAAEDLRKKAIAAGLKPPPTSSPEFVTFARQTVKAAMPAEKVMEFNQKAADLAEKRENEKKEFAARGAERLQKERDLVQQREIANAQRASEAADRKVNQQIAREQSQERIQIEKDKSAGHLSTKQKDTADAVNSVLGEAVVHLHNAGSFQLGSEPGAFVNLTDEHAIDALVAKAGNIITPQNAQMVQTANYGKARAVLQAETVGLGRTPTAEQIKEGARILGYAIGDSPYTQLYKDAVSAQIVRNRGEHVHKTDDPDLQALHDKDMASLRQYPDPDLVLKAAMKDPLARSQILNYQKTVGENLGRIRDDIASKGIPSTPAHAVDTDNPLLK